MRAVDAIRWAADRIGGESPRLDAELLVADVLGLERRDVLLKSNELDVDLSLLAPRVRRRAEGEPLAYITGHREFWSLDVLVTPDVLIPRADSETIVEAALEHGRGSEAPRVLDLGTGSGCLLLAILQEIPAAWGLGVDRSQRAAAVARANAERLEMSGRASFLVADWTDPIRGRFDIVVANPPYIGVDEVLPREVSAFEPAEALFAGADGLDAYRVLIPRLESVLADNGMAHLEIGAEQGKLVEELSGQHGFAVCRRTDLAGRVRCLSLRRMATRQRPRAWAG